MTLLGWNVEVLDQGLMILSVNCGKQCSLVFRIWTKNFITVYSTLTVLKGENPVFDQMIKNSGLLRHVKKELMYHELKEYWQTVDVDRGSNQ